MPGGVTKPTSKEPLLRLPPGFRIDPSVRVVEKTAIGASRPLTSAVLTSKSFPIAKEVSSRKIMLMFALPLFKGALLGNSLSLINRDIGC